MRLARERMKGHTMAFHALDTGAPRQDAHCAEAMRVGFEVDDADAVRMG